MHFLTLRSLFKPATFLFILFSIFTANVFAQQNPKLPKGLVRQEAAINRLNNRLPAVAQKYGKTPGELRRVLLEDPTLYVDSTDQLLYIDPVIEQTEGVSADSPSEPLAGPFPNSQTFALHSRPGSNRVIYLDFNGHVTSGTTWNTNFTGGQTINSAPFSIDGDPSSFNQQEQDAIQYIWQRVAEDYAPFDVDVTTEDPGDDAIIRNGSSDAFYGTRAVISPTDFIGGIGGVAFLGVFNYPGSSYKPVFVMSANLSNNEKNIAEATSHEVGHNLNLEHDGSPTSGYYAGHGDWAPIMGVGYYRSVSQWSRGEYSGANNFQDDLAVMQSYGISLIADDHGNTSGDATVLSGSGINASGLITTRNDVDAFRFQIGSGNVSININPASRGANLDIQAKISDAQGNVLATSNPSGLSASFNQFLSGGVYFLTIDGVGAGDFYTGYNDYASIGQYSITGTLPGGGSSQPPVAAVSVTTTSGTAPLTVSFSSVNSSDPDGTIVGYSWNFGDGTSSTDPNPVKVYNSAGTFTATLTVTDNSGLSDTESVTITATQPSSNQPPVAVAGANVTSGPAPLNVNFSGQDSYDPDGSIVGYSWNFGDGNTSSQTNPSHTYNNVGNYTATLTVTDNNGATNSRSLGINVQSQQPPASDYTLVATPESVAPGGQLTVSWTAPSGSSTVDWVGIFRVGASNYEYGWWRYTDGATSGSYGLPAPTEPGQYEFRYLLNDSFTSVKTSNVITVAQSNPNPTTVIFVNNISMSIANRRGRAVVTVYGNDGLPRPNVSVTGNWSGLSNSASTGVTDGNGQVTFISTASRRSGTFTFTVTDLSASDCAYNPSLNVETSDSISQ